MTRSEILQVAKPILFNTEMVRAIFDGRKTVTRRAIKPQQLRVLDSPYHKEHPEVPDKVLIGKLCKPSYSPGDYLYVRETWGTRQSNNCFANSGIECPHSSCGEANGECFPLEYVYKASDNASDGENIKWRPSIHMPKEAARIFLWVTDVKVGQLQETFSTRGSTIFNLRTEGIEIPEECVQCIESYGNPCCVDKEGEECGLLDDAQSTFADLWDSTIPPKDRDKYGWAANPWVWVIAFERVEVEE